MKKNHSAARPFPGLPALIFIFCLLTVFSSAMADYEIAYEGTIVVQDAVPVAAPYGGRIAQLAVRKGDLVQEGSVIAQIAATPVYAPLEGTITGIYAAEGDSADVISDRYGAVMYIEPLHKYKITASTDRAYNSIETKYIHLGETVYLSCNADKTRFGAGIVTALSDSSYTVEVTEGEFYINEKVGIYRQSDYAKETCVGRGTVGRISPVAVKESGSILKIHVSNGDFVKRGELLYETVSGDLDGLCAPQGSITAPFAGIVASVDTSAGSNVNKNDTLLTIYPTSAMQICFNLSESDLNRLSVGDPVTVEFDRTNEDTARTTGTIASISHIGESESEESGNIVYQTYVDFKPIGDIRLGMNVTLYSSRENNMKESVHETDAESSGTEKKTGRE